MLSNQLNKALKSTPSASKLSWVIDCLVEISFAKPILGFTPLLLFNSYQITYLQYGAQRSPLIVRILLRILIPHLGNLWQSYLKKYFISVTRIIILRQ